MKLSLSSMLFRPFALAIVVVFAALIVLYDLTPRWYSMVKSFETDTQVTLDAQNFVSQLMSEIERSAELLKPFNLAPKNLARFIDSNLNLSSITYTDTQVASILFQASIGLPFLTQLTYIDTEYGWFFAYDLDLDEPQAIFNDVIPSSDYLNDSYQRFQTSYYGRSVNRDSGKLDDEAYPVSVTINETWFKHALNSPNGFTAVVQKWISSDDLVFLSSARIEGRGLLCLGFAVDAITNFITAKSSSYGVSLYLVATDGTVLEQGLKDTQMMILKGNDVSVQIMNSRDGDRQVSIGTVSCTNDGVSEPTVLDCDNKEYIFYCSPIDIMGVHSVYALAFERDGLVSFAHSNNNARLILLIIIFTIIFLFIIIRSIRSETYLRSSLIKEMEATEKAERKSMSKSTALATASHDIRASLAGLTGLIDASRDEVVLDSAVETNLKLMDTCIKDLLGLLNSILDTSKIEAGKMQLDEEEFDISQLVEDAVDLYHPVAMKKGVDVILDACNGSLFKHSHVKGDRGKLRQIICNLLSNAVKFTDKGYIKVRVWAQKPNPKNSIDGIPANGNDNFLKKLMWFWMKNDAKKHDVEAIQVSPNAMEFVFEVEDSGKGIPNDKRQFVFENYVQVKENDVGQGGTGLGLGIVKSLVRLMHGDIAIVDKNVGEEGTCFRFNILLTTSTSDEGTSIVSTAFHGRKLYEVAGVLKPDDKDHEAKRPLKPERGIKENAWEERLKPDDKDHEAKRPLKPERGIKENAWEERLKPDDKDHEARETTDNPKPLAGMKILVVEDSALLRRIALALLQKLGAIVEQCSNGEEAVTKIRHELEKCKEGHSIVLPYHYILMDCQMPVMDGFEATEEIRKMEMEYGIHTPIISLTAHTSGSNAASEALKSGMDSYLHKPLSEPKLLEAIASIHRKRSDGRNVD